MYIKVKNSGIDISYENMERVLLSPAIPEYHPIKDFFERHKKKDSRGHIAMLSKSIKTDTGGYDFVEDYLKRWFVGAVSMVYGKHSPLCLMLIGKTQNTGKTEFFRRILPEEIQSYYGESKWERGKDDEILMCQKWIILNDEYEGRTVDDEKKMKQLLSAQTFNIRAPYGRRHEDRKRIAALCATSNEENVLKDPTGNRRFIPIRILAIDHVIYNQVDKVKLWLEAYHLYKSGFDWEIRGEAQKKLEESTAEYNQTSLEAELIMKYYSPAEETEPCEMMTNSDIKVELEKKTNQRLSSRKIGLELVRLGFKKKVIKHYGTSKQVYFIQKNDDSAKTSDEQAPF